jgi:hypothetical protein
LHRSTGIVAIVTRAASDRLTRVGGDQVEPNSES